MTAQARLHKPMRRLSCLVLAACLTLSGCWSSMSSPDLGGIYNMATLADDSQRNPIIVIPGILGSRLRQGSDGRIVWGAFESGSLDVRNDEGLRALALPMQQGVPLSQLRDDLTADKVLDKIRVQLLRLPLESRAYFKLLGVLGAGGYRDQSLGGALRYGDKHFTCFQFPYDWRRDIPENARLLGEFIETKRRFVADEQKRRYGIDKPVRFDLVAHSMGGLVTRYYLEYGGAEPSATQGVPWSGASGIDRVVLIAPPNGGALDSLDRLVNGADPSWLLPHFDSALLGTMPAIFQLLPRSRYARVTDGKEKLDVFDAATWQTQQWGLLDPAQADVLRRLLPDQPDPLRRQQIARDHLEKVLARAREVQAALDRPAPLPEGLTLHLLAADAEATPAQMRAGQKPRLTVVASGAGDGIVLRASALQDERVAEGWQPRLQSPIEWSSVTFLGGDHLSVFDNEAFADNLLYLLLEQPLRLPQQRVQSTR